MNIADHTPIIVGVGQTLSRWTAESAADAPSPIGLSIEACSEALNDTGQSESLRNAIDVIVSVRTNQDSVEGVRAPFGRCANPPATVARALNLSPERCVYSKVGGDQPQYLVNEFAEALFNGEARAVLITGAEAMGAAKAARKRRLKLDWSETAGAEMEDRGIGADLATDYELANGLSLPVRTYPLFENALRKRLGMDRASYRRMISELLAGFSDVAATHPFAQFPTSRSAEFLAEESKENYKVSDVYNKWHVAQDAVNQGAALILTTVGEAKKLRIDESKWVYLHGYAQTADLPVSERPDLSKSKSIELVIEQALQSAQLSASDLSFIDLYSCFPCVVQIAAEALGLDWRAQIMTVTGGLPFFGGAGNNYSMHAIATVIERTRETPGKYGLVLANGGFMSKHAAGVYAAKPKENWQPISSTGLDAAIASQQVPKLLSAESDAEIETYSVSYGRHAAERGFVVAKTQSGRVMAKFKAGHRPTIAAFLAKADPIGETIYVAPIKGKNYIQTTVELGSDADARQFENVRVERNGHILEVTLNRPESYNALSGAAHYELGEIFDEYERDRDLWVAIITGAGDKAFCSGNDLKVTARGGDLTVPPSGFAGLCYRTNRTKPVIAAVNGVAMGGGLEIVLACDLAVMDRSAKCALPEVKVGLFAAAGGIQRLTRQIGRKDALKMILTGQHIQAEDALRLGLVNELADPGEALVRARALAEEIISVSPSAVKASLQSLNDFDRLDYALAESLKNGEKISRNLFSTNDLREGVTAFAEKRRPNWTNS